MLLTQEEVVMICSYCAAQTESVLALSCQHYICIPCAIKHSPRSAVPQLKCEVCGLTTEVNGEAVSRLRLLASIGTNPSDGATHDIASLQDTLKKLDMEQFECSKKIAKLTELCGASIAKIRQKFTVLRSQIDSKESSLIALAQRQLKDHVAKLQRLAIQIAHEREHLLDAAGETGRVKIDLKQLSQQIESDFLSMHRSVDLDINLKSIHNLVFDLEMKQGSREAVNKAPLKDEQNIQGTQQTCAQERQNELLKKRSTREFSREDSYQRIMDKLSESKKKMNESLSTLKNRSVAGSASQDQSHPRHPLYKYKTHLQQS